MADTVYSAVVDGAKVQTTDARTAKRWSDRGATVTARTVG